MYAPAPPDVRVEAAVAITVTRNGTGDLEDGIVTVLERNEHVHEVQEVQLHGLTPRLNDMLVQATVVVTMSAQAVDDRDPEATLADGFGVSTVDVGHVEPPGVVDGASTAEYG